MGLLLKHANKKQFLHRKWIINIKIVMKIDEPVVDISIINKEIRAIKNTSDFNALIVFSVLPPILNYFVRITSNNQLYRW
jgi:hypothetical protein